MIDYGGGRPQCDSIHCLCSSTTLSERRYTADVSSSREPRTPHPPRTGTRLRRTIKNQKISKMSFRLKVPYAGFRVVLLNILSSIHRSAAPPSLSLSLPTDGWTGTGVLGRKEVHRVRVPRHSSVFAVE